ATPLKVGSRPQGNNRWGVQDLIGNVWEWTSSKISAYPGNRTPIPTSTKDWNAIRGGGFDRDPTDKNSPVSSCLRTFVSPESKIPILGFRLVRSAQ
ncbi:MAG: SUMF1/EgtB/PvdO family nonheme iron enzyme, partial [Acidobacteriota bacterium]